MISRIESLASTALVGTLLTIACGLSPVQAQVIDLGTLIVDDHANSGGISISIPAGNWTSYTFTTDWSVVGGDPWSSDAIWSVTDGPVSDPGTVVYADPGPATNSQFNGDPITLSWAGFFDVSLANPPLADGFFLSLQTFADSSAQWSNTVLTLGTEILQPPETVATFNLTPNSPMDMDLQTLEPANVAWYEINHPGGLLTVTTDFAETRLIGDFDDIFPDTEIGLFSSTGDLLAENDDIFFPTNLKSEIAMNLAASTYYAATGGFDTEFADGFAAVSTASRGGDIKFGASIVPEPATAILLGVSCIGLLLTRRR
jgi:hypothetical protein